jgi:hypothetical protein
MTNYEIGYGRPPRHTRYRKGESGNPRGRRPGRKNHKTELLEELSARVPITEHGRRRQVSMQTLIIKRMVADAAKGQPKAREQVLKLVDRIEGSESGNQDAASAQEDAEILARFKARLIEEIKAQDV